MSKRMPERLSENQEAKKRRLEESSMLQHPDELSLLENLTRCENVLGKIIGLLPEKDILSLTLTSKALNSFIGDNPKILEKFTMTFPQIDAQNEEDYNFKDIRRYPNWKLNYGIHKNNLPVAMKFFSRYGEHVKSLEIDRKVYTRDQPLIRNGFRTSCSITKPSLIRILKQCKNLEELVIGKDYNLSRWTYNEPADLPRLLKLRYDVNSFNFHGLFLNCNLQSLEMKAGYLRYDERQNNPQTNANLKQFFKAQSNLEKLCVAAFPEGFFDDDQMATVSFKLKSLSIELRHQELNNNENFINFLNLHKESLVELALGDCSCFSLFKEFKNIKNLSLGSEVSAHHLTGIWPSVEKLSITASIDLLSEPESRAKFEQSFPNVSEISIKICSQFIEIDFLAELPKIVKLNLSGCTVATNLTCSNLKYLNLNNVRINEGVNLNFGNNQLKELIVKCGTNHQFIQNFLQREDTNLNVLKVLGYDYAIDRWYPHNPRLHRIINENRHKIQVLTISASEWD